MEGGRYSKRVYGGGEDSSLGKASFNFSRLENQRVMSSESFREIISKLEFYAQPKY